MSAPLSKPNLFFSVAFPVFVALFFVTLFCALEIKPFSDDTTFFTAATSGQSPLDYLAGRYRTWTGRLAIEGVMFLTIASPVFWKLAIPSCLLLCAYSIWKCFFTKRLNYSQGIPLCLFLLLLVNHAILDSTAFYVTGFYNYLLPASAGVFACAIFAQPAAFSRPEKIIVVPFTLLASQSEQVGLSVLIIFSAIFLWDRKTATNYRLLLLAIAFAGFATLLSAPGNYLRLASELRYMPEFADYSATRKILTGFDLFNAHYIDSNNLYPKIIALLTTLLAIRKKIDLKHLALTAVVFGVFQGNIFSYIINNEANETFSIRYLSSGLGLTYFLSYTLTIISLVSLCYIFKRIFSNNENFYLSVLFLVLSTATTTVVGLSPTAYESGQRVLLAGDIISLMLICLLLKEAIRHCYSVQATEVNNA